MYYLLNFSDHTFITVNSDNKLYEILTEHISAGCDIDNYEIVNCWDPDTRMEAKTFMTNYQNE